MKKKLAVFIASALSLFYFDVFAGAQSGSSYVKTVFNERNGLPTGEANDVLQTSDGYLWVGSYGGLIRYDGTEFLNYSTEGILPSSSVRMMFEDAQGRLWIGTNDAGVFVFENDAVSQPEGQPKDSFLCVRGFAQDSEGTVYAFSNSGIAEIRDGVMRVYDAPEIAGQTVYSLGIDKFGRVWGAASSSGCVVLSNGSVTGTVTGAEYFDDGESVYSVTSGKSGEIWLGGSGNGLLRLDFASESLENGINVTKYKTGSVSTHNSLRVTAGDALAISGLHGFGVLYPDGSFSEFTESDGAVSVNSACLDYEGNVWLASSSFGIVRFSAGCFTSPNDAAELSGITINAIAISGGVSYIGYDGGLIICGKDWGRVQNELTEKFSGIRIRDIIADKSGRVWIVSYSEFPVVCYDTASGGITSYSSADGLTGDRARTLLELSDGSIAVGTQNGLCIIKDGRITDTYPDLEYPAILSLLETPEGALLAGSDGGGIYEIKDGAVTSHSFSDGLSEGVVLRMLKDDKADGYFISAGSSLYYWENGRFTKLSSLKKEAGSIFDFYLINDKLWLLQNNGVLCVDREDLLSGGDGVPTVYSFSHGLSGSLNANTWHCIYEGELYLATRSGISVFGFTSPENAVPKLIINEVNVDGELFAHPKEIRLSGSVQRITIDFAVLSFTGTAHLSAAYKLSGFDSAETIIENGQSGNVSYTNLPGGEYTFNLRVFDPSEPGNSSVLTLKVVKEKRLTEQPLFWVLCILAITALAAGIVMAIFTAKIRSARRRQKEYRDILEQSLLTFAGTIDAKDKYTNGHSTRVALYSRELARRMGMSDEEQEHIYYVALLHDIGKIGIPDNILNKPGKLTPEEREVIQTHPVIGAQILKNFTALEGISDGAKYHHERFDGKGYCEGRAGEKIPLVARIICVADTYDAMSSERCYRKPLSEEYIISEFEEWSGSQFDPSIVPHMLDMINDGTVPIILDTDKNGKDTE